MHSYNEGVLTISTSISNTQTDGQVRNLIARALVSRIIQAHTSKTKFKVEFL